VSEKGRSFQSLFLQALVFFDNGNATVILFDASNTLKYLFPGVSSPSIALPILLFLLRTALLQLETFWRLSHRWINI